MTGSEAVQPDASNILICCIISKLPDTQGQMFGRLQRKKESNFQFLKHCIQ